MRVVKWGNTLAIPLPCEVVRDLQIGEGDEVSVRLCAPRELTLTVLPNTEAVLAALKRFEGRAPLDFNFDREDANKR